MCSSLVHHNSLPLSFKGLIYVHVRCQTPKQTLWWGIRELSGLWFFNSPRLLTLKTYLLARSITNVICRQRLGALFWIFPEAVRESQQYWAFPFLYNVIIPSYTLWPNVSRHLEQWFLFVFKTTGPSISDLIKRCSLKIAPCHSSLRYGEWRMILPAADLSCWGSCCLIISLH
jgi:hypothetical protein